MSSWIRPVLVADMIASRLIRERFRVAQRVEEALEELHRRFEGEFEAPLVATRGLGGASPRCHPPGVTD